MLQVTPPAALASSEPHIRVKFSKHVTRISEGRDALGLAQGGYPTPKHDPQLPNDAVVQPLVKRYAQLFVPIQQLFYDPKGVEALLGSPAGTRYAFAVPTIEVDRNIDVPLAPARSHAEPLDSILEPITLREHEVAPNLARIQPTPRRAMVPLTGQGRDGQAILREALVRRRDEVATALVVRVAQRLDGTGQQPVVRVDKDKPPPQASAMPVLRAPLKPLLD